MSVFPSTFFTDQKYRRILEALDGSKFAKTGENLTSECGFGSNMKFAGAVAQLIQRNLVQNNGGAFTITQDGHNLLMSLKDGKVRTETVYKADVSARISLDIWKEFQKAVIDKHGGLDPYKNIELEEALKLWMERNSPKAGA